MNAKRSLRPRSDCSPAANECSPTMTSTARRDATLAVVQHACATNGEIDCAAAVRFIRDYNAYARNEQAKLN